MDIGELFESANKLRGTDAFALDKNGACGLLAGNDLAIQLVHIPETDELLTSAVVGVEPSAGREILYRSILSAMYMFRGTAGATIAVNDAAHEICLMRHDQVAFMDGEKLLETIDTFAEVARKWRQALLAFSPVTADAERESTREKAEARTMRRDGFIQV